MGKLSRKSTRWEWLLASLALAIVCCATFQVCVADNSGLRVGYIDTSGAMVIPPSFGDGQGFSEGLAPVCPPGQSEWGYIDKTGKMVIEPRFHFAVPFSEGLARVRVRSSNAEVKWGYIDHSGAFVIEPKFSDACDFSEGLAAATLEGTYGEVDKEAYGYIDKTGQFVIEPQFHSREPFREGIAHVHIGAESGAIHGYIKSDGAFLLKPESGVSTSGFAEGCGIVQRAEGSQGYHALCIDGQGAKLFESSSKDTGIGSVRASALFSEGLIAFHTKGQGYGFMDRSGKVAIKPQFSQVAPFSEGLASAALKDGYGYIDKTGTFVIPPAFSAAGGFSEERAAVGVGLRRTDHFIEEHDDVARYGYIDRTGEMVIPAHFRQAGAFSEGLAPVAVKVTPEGKPVFEEKAS